MTEAEARAWLEQHDSRETMARLERFEALLRAEMAHQNLISAASAAQLWSRHIVDSVQLLALAAGAPGRWIDIGTGAGFPGLVIAMAGRPVTMIEPRPRRTAFLQRVVDELDLDAEVVTGKAQAIDRQTDVISARAVASANDIFAFAGHLSTEETLWLLPKGKSARSELAAAQQRWQGVFHVERSVTDPEAGIIVARQVRRRK